MHTRSFFPLPQLSYKLSTRNQGLGSTLLPPFIFFANAASWRSLTARHHPKSFLIDIVVTLQLCHYLPRLLQRSISYRLSHTHALYYALIKYEALLHFFSLLLYAPPGFKLQYNDVRYKGEWSRTGARQFSGRIGITNLARTCLLLFP